MPALDTEIDELYQQPLAGFTAARNALAKTIGGADAARVRKLPKPTLVPWAINQVYWQARPVFDRLRAAGEQLRTAQIAALKGKPADVRGAAEAHRKAIAQAVERAAELSAAAGSHPNPDELARTLEALSLATELPEPPGRLTQPLRPAGFEALAGVPVAQLAKHGEGPPKGGHYVHREGPQVAKRGEGPPKGGHYVRNETLKERDRERREAEKRAAAERKTLEAAIEKAEAERDRAAAAEAQARLAWDRAKTAVKDAEQALERARHSLMQARRR